MKNGKNPTLAVKRQLSKLGIDHKAYLVVKNDMKELVLEHRDTGQIVIIKK